MLCSICVMMVIVIGIDVGTHHNPFFFFAMFTRLATSLHNVQLKLFTCLLEHLSFFNYQEKMFKYPKDLVVGLLNPFFANVWLKLVLKCYLLPFQELNRQIINIRNPWIVWMRSQFLTPWKRNLKNVRLEFQKTYL